MIFFFGTYQRCVFEAKERSLKKGEWRHVQDISDVLGWTEYDEISSFGVLTTEQNYAYREAVARKSIYDVGRAKA